jgi:CDP-diacylglycerol--glycerol-3-phosphate 3-phosphatidyltransferase
MILNVSTYAIKPRFQRFLIPARNWLVKHGFTANQITVFACLLCVAYALVLAGPIGRHTSLTFLPLILLLRMMLNALDGMVASHTGSQTAVGSVLNEVGDVIADTALLSAFILVAPHLHDTLIVLIVISLLIEFLGLAVHQAVRIRPQDGPFGKSDRAFFLGALALLILFFPERAGLHFTWTGVGVILGLMTFRNRFRHANKA